MAVTPPRRTQAQRREHSRRRMLDAALDLLAERRSLRFTLAEVGERAGYSRGLPGQVFASKAGLIEALAQHILETSDARTPHETRGEGLEAVLTTVRLLIIGGPRQHRIHQAVHVLLGEGSAAGSPYQAAAAALNQVSTGYLSKHLRIAAAKGEVRGDLDFRAQASLIIAAVRGTVLNWQLEPDRYDLEALWAELDASLKRSLV